MTDDALLCFESLGWSVKNKSGESVIWKSSGDNEISAVVQVFQLPAEQKITVSVSTASKGFNSICGEIFGEKPTHQPLNQTQIEKRKVLLGGDDFKECSDEIMTWWSSQSNDDAIKTCTNFPPETGAAQLMHLAALAYLGDYMTLMDYQDIFARGNRMNFTPMITKEMIDRALDIALERG